MESADSQDEQGLNTGVTANAVDTLLSKESSIVSTNTSDVLGDNKLYLDNRTELNVLDIQKIKVSHVNGHMLKDQLELNNTSNSKSQDAVKFCQGDTSLLSSNQSTNKQTHTEPTMKKMTGEEISDKRKEVIQDLNQTISLMSNIQFRHLDQENAPFTKEFRQCILKLAKSYYIFKMGEFPYSVVSDFRREIGLALNKNGSVKIMCDVLSDGLKRKDFIDNDGKMVNEYWFPMKNILLTLLNFTDLNEIVRMSVTNHPDVLNLLVELLNEWQIDHLNQRLSEEQNKLIKWTLSIFHNCAGTDDNIPKLRDIEVIQVVTPYLDSKNENIRLSSISVLALLVNEEEAELLGTHVSIFQFMIKKLSKALKKEDRKDLGWSAAELTTAIGKLARNDANKKVLVDEGCLPLLTELLRTGDEKEVKEALSCIWTLSFDKENKKKMVDEPGMVTAVHEKYLTSSGSIRHDCQGILWSLRDELLVCPEYTSIGEEISNMKNKTVQSEQVASTSGRMRIVPSATKPQGHIMISYQWGNQEIIKQICQELRSHGVRVWIDIDYMGGSTLQAMAKAVEDSFAVIIAMSQKYKDSPNTRAEAEYTFQQRKTIIPLIMQKGYRPDGWLGLILGTKFYYDFSGKYTFESRMNALLGAVRAIMKGDSVNGHIEPKSVSPTPSGLKAEEPTIETHSSAATSHVPSTRSSHIDEQAIKTWTKGEITMWLTKYSLEDSSLVYLTGEEIIFLHKLKYEAPEFFYHCLETKLHLESLLDLSRATDALADLTW